MIVARWHEVLRKFEAQVFNEQPRQAVLPMWMRTLHLTQPIAGTLPPVSISTTSPEDHQW